MVTEEFTTTTYGRSRDLYLSFLSAKKLVNVIFFFFQVSDCITVRLLSGTYAMLSFKCEGESVQLPLYALPDSNQSKTLVRFKQMSKSLTKREG